MDVRWFLSIVILTLTLGSRPGPGGCSLSTQALTDSKIKVLLTLTDGFFPVLVNWVQFYIALCGWDALDDLFFVCFDWRERNKLRKLLGINCHVVINLGTSNVSYITPNYTLLENRPNKPLNPQQTVWVHRAQIMSLLLSAGFDVLMVDLDAYWLRNPFPLIDSLVSMGYDVVGSRGSFPDFLAIRNNATLCLGFAFFRANTQTAALWSRVLDTISRMKHPDDQLGINEIIFFDKSFTMEAPSTLKFFRGAFNSSGKHFRLALLPAEKVQRVCDSNTSNIAVVAHCYSQEKIKSTNAKKFSGAGFGLWRVRKNWQKIFLTYNMSIAGNNSSQLLSSLMI